jgi:hypothetical protein
MIIPLNRLANAFSFCIPGPAGVRLFAQEKGMSYRSDDREVLEFLREQLDVARIEYTKASAEFDLMVRDVPSGIPSPDGTLRIHKAGQASRAALQHYMRALKRLAAFLPPD